MNNIHLQPQTTSKSEIPLRDSAANVKSTFHDLPGFRSEAKDCLQQLQANISLLEDKCGRISFMMSELRSVIRK